MDYQELIAKAEANLKAKNALRVYVASEGANYRPGAETNFGAKFNVEYFKRFAFKFRLIDSAEASTETTFFNRTFKTPIFCGAVSGLNNITEKPTVKVASGIKDSGSMMWLGTLSPDQVKAAIDTGVPAVRIVKPFRNLDAMVKELKAAEEAGAIAVGTDIDFFYGGKKGEQVHAPKAVAPKTVADLKMLAGVTKLPFIVKGVLSVEDAEKALEIGAGAIVVSNHNGIVIDYAAHPLEVLPEIKKVVGNRVPIIADSGFRRGSDVIKALAMGADAVLVGWAVVMGLAANGSEGVTEMMNIMTAELQRIMSVTGCRDLSKIDRSILLDRGYFREGC